MYVWNLIKKYWNIWATPIISFLIAWILDFRKSSMDTVTSFASMSLVVFSILTVLKFNIDNKYNKKKTLIEKVGTSQKQLKVVEHCIDPLKQGEEIVDLLIETKKVLNERKENKMIDWIKKNKGAIISVLEFIVAITLHLTDVINLVEPWNTIVLIIIYGIPVITAILTSGFTSVETQKAVDTLKNNLKSKSKENKAKLELLKEQLETTQNALDEVSKNIDKLELLRSINAPYDVNTLSLYQAQKKQLADTVTKIQEQIDLWQNQK